MLPPREKATQTASPSVSLPSSMSLRTRSAASVIGKSNGKYSISLFLYVADNQDAGIVTRSSRPFSCGRKDRHKAGHILRTGEPSLQPDNLPLKGDRRCSGGQRRGHNHLSRTLGSRNRRMPEVRGERQNHSQPQQAHRGA